MFQIKVTIQKVFISIDIVHYIFMILYNIAKSISNITKNIIYIRIILPTGITGYNNARVIIRVNKITFKEETE